MLPDAPSLLLAVFVVLAAGYVRGYGGFGFSMIAVLGLSLCDDPARVVPVILLLEVAASLMLIGQVWRQVAWKTLGWLGIGAVAGTPAGVWALQRVAPEAMKLWIGVVTLLLAGLLRTGYRLRQMPGRGAILAAGWVSGLLNGAAAIGGPPAILFFFSSPAGAAVSRASLIAYFFFTDIYAGAACAAMGLFDRQALFFGVLMIAPTAGGIYLGQRAFGAADPERFRRRVLFWLMVLAGATLLRALVQIFQ